MRRHPPFRWIKKTAFARWPAPRHASQGTTARRLALLSGATSARAKQHGGVCFHRARASAARGQNSTAACASAWHHVKVNSHSTEARRRALLQSGHGATSTAIIAATTARRHVLLQERPWQPGHSSTAACASVWRHVSQSNTTREGLLPQSAHLVSPRAQQHGGVRFYVATRQHPERSSAGALASAERHDNQSAAALRRALLQSGGHGETKRGRKVGAVERGRPKGGGQKKTHGGVLLRAG